MFEAINENLFAFILFVASIISGCAWVYDLIVEKPKRQKNFEELKGKGEISKKEKRALLEPKGVIGQVGSVFFVLILVFLFRSFLYEPFRIPSGSMMPTLLPGDFIAVNKHSFGIRNPLTNNVLIETSRPQRGDIIVFKYPEDKSIDFIKRVVGLPGDTIIYQDKHLYIKKFDAPKGSEPELISTRMIESLEEEMMGFAETFDVYEESFGPGESHQIRVNPNAPVLSQYFYVQKNELVGKWVVPADSYFAMGDNRDNSKDSRFWGFVPFENIVGKTSTIWLSFDFDHGAKSSMPSWVPSAVRFDRIGSIK